MSWSSIRSQAEGPGGLSAVWVAALAAAACAGLWARLTGFGGRALAVDEAISLLAVNEILEHGVARLLDGGLYVQGLIPHYLMALSAALFGESEAALRLPALLAGLALPALAYRYARERLGPAAAAALAMALLVSSWQIEFSRFGRMYTVFGCVTLLYLTRVDRSLAGAEWSKRYRAHAWAAVAVLCHLEGVLLAPLLFVPFLDPARFASLAEKVRYGAATAATVGGIAVFALFDFRHWGARDALPVGYTPPETSAVRTPEAVLWAPALSGEGALAAIVIALTAVALLLAVSAWSRPRRVQEAGAWTALACTAGLLHQLALAAPLGVIAMARPPRGERRWRRLVWIAAACSLWPVVWLVRMAAGAGAPESLAEKSLAGAFRALFASWPDFYTALVLPWSAVYPALGAAIAAAIVFLWLRDGDGPWVKLVAGPAGVAAYGLGSMGLVRYFYESVRYQFFLYPMLLAALAAATTRLLGPRWGAAAFLAVFAVAGDFDPVHIAQAGGREAEYRLGRFRDRENAWYPRTDYRGAAAALERIVRERGPVPVFIGTAIPAAHYFQGDYAMYLDRDEHPFHESSRRRGTVEMWTGRPLLSTPEELRRATEGRDEAVLVRRVPGDTRELDPEVIWPGRVGAVRQEFSSEDGDIDVVRVELLPGDVP